MFWLSENSIAFPPPELADSDGVLAVGGDLSPPRLIEAYRQGVFPWYSDYEPILWWTPDPRFVLYPDNLKVSKSMRPYFNQKKFAWTFDRDFRAVITNCQQQNRPGQFGTWITDEMLEAYVRLHELGFAHSVEVWKGEVLVGGLYGISLGKVFFGESMFALEKNASKFGFIALVRKLTEWDYELIDCQQETSHLRSLGAELISRKKFMGHLEVNPWQETKARKWVGLEEL
jgi:leucyl/phenylalanyl-tRNA--protein transferase